jgi:hypothetical protein
VLDTGLLGSLIAVAGEHSRQDDPHLLETLGRPARLGQRSIAQKRNAVLEGNEYGLQRVFAG